MRILKSKKGFYIPALAALAIVLFFILLFATNNPAFKDTLLQIVGAATGKP